VGKILRPSDITGSLYYSELGSRGHIDFEIEDDGIISSFRVNNRILKSGRVNLAKSLANSFGDSFEYFITGISFGSGGTAGGSPRYVDDTREGLFGPTVITKPVIASINPDLPTQVTFTTVITFDEAVGSTINEMALKMRNGDYFSMATFGDITKSSSMQLTWNWRITFV
jgi:hypothetical protein